MTLLEELELVLKELEEAGIKYPDPLYNHVKQIMTTIDSIQGHFLGVKHGS